MGLGRGVALADLDGDGCVELVAGAPSGTAPSRTGTGPRVAHARRADCPRRRGGRIRRRRRTATGMVGRERGRREQRPRVRPRDRPAGMGRRVGGGRRPRADRDRRRASSTSSASFSEEASRASSSARRSPAPGDTNGDGLADDRRRRAAVRHGDARRGPREALVRRRAFRHAARPFTRSSAVTGRCTLHRRNRPREARACSRATAHGVVAATAWLQYQLLPVSLPAARASSAPLPWA